MAALFLLQTLVGAATQHYRADLGSFFGIDLAQVLPYNLARTFHVAAGAVLRLDVVPRGGHLPRADDRAARAAEAGPLAYVLLGAGDRRLRQPRRRVRRRARDGSGRSGRGSAIRGSSTSTWPDLAGAARRRDGVLDRDPVSRPQGTAAQRTGRKHAVAVLPRRAGDPVGLLRFGLLFAGETFTVADFWRFWVVHLWVEDFLELFTTVMVAYIFVLLGVIRERVALTVIFLDILLYSAGGVIGTMHHLYFSGEPAEHLALGAVFSAAEVIPLTFLTVEAWSFLQLGARQESRSKIPSRTAGR